MKMEMIFATTNAGKTLEVKKMLGNVSLLTMKEAGINIDIEENGKTFEENALIKARTVSKLSGKIAIADDSGLEIDYLNKEPGVHSARFMGHDTPYSIKNAKILEMLKGVPEEKRTARFVSAVAVVFPSGREFVERGTIEGSIGTEIKGKNGFGYDPIFYVSELKKYSAELSLEEKNKISHRGKAVAKIKKKIEEIEK
ncbi:MAG: RdgB/HAM1 family non-canonical purine NTP pyrophosphatase [Clostridia bacterium]|nr:RdgB/HAM1 family non-canonical purine NTP pyrophosphatase [Clostridia bacterium]MCI2001279.1 RdgB/HAM1 family non-canonical purine NTP pyrophosphatase [Clostridia bacterium]